MSVKNEIGLGTMNFMAIITYLYGAIYVRNIWKDNLKIK
jgi:hypothetical protein